MVPLALMRAALFGTMGLRAAHASVYRPHFSRAEFGESFLTAFTSSGLGTGCQ